MSQETATDTPRGPYSYIEFEFRAIICLPRIVIPSSEFRTEDKIPSLACTADFATSGGGRIRRRPNHADTTPTRSGAAAAFLND